MAVKVRLRGQSIRFRLTQTEVAGLLTGRPIVESTAVAPGRSIAFALRPLQAAEVSARLDGDLFVLALPSRKVQELASTELVGFSAELPVSDGVTLHVLVEKDFVCLDSPAGEPQDDAYPNPSAVCAPAKEL